MSKKEVKILPDLKTKEQIPVTKPLLPPLEEYKELLADSHVRFLEIPEDLEYNHVYFSVIFPSEKSLLEAVDKMAENGISPRRCFYPSLSSLNCEKSDQMAVAKETYRRVLCLHAFYELQDKQFYNVVKCIA
ncbi:MAG: hypothetical protein EA362_08845 [Saprospirales bacterium]|nr:MAG: hypothetical protein EA362_08845 [Saprospirales bacterium]